MSKRSELMVFDKTITIPGVRVTRTSMVFERVDEETLATAGAFLQAVGEFSAWWRGDHLAATCGYKLAKEEQENGRAFDPLTQEDKRKQYTSEYSIAWNVERGTCKQYLWIARFYNSSSRLDELSWSHHVEATNGANGDMAVAQNWLDLAMKHRWSVSQLRAAIRKTNRADEADADGPEAQSLLPIELTNCRRWASAAIHRVADMSEEEARAHLAELEQVHAYIMALYKRCAPIGALSAAISSGSPLAASHLPGGKESLSAAA